MLRSILLVIGVIGLVDVGADSLLSAKPQQSSASQSSVVSRSAEASQYRQMLTRYCFTCHNEKLKTAGLTLDRLDMERIPSDAEVWEKVIGKLRTGAMPPAGMPRPDRSFYDSFAGYLETSIDR